MARSQGMADTSMRDDAAVLPAGVRLPVPAARWQHAFPGTKDQAGRVRAALRALLACCPIADDVLTLVSELVSNAICYTDSQLPGGYFTVRVHDFPGKYIYAAVEDGGSDWDGDLTKAAECPHGLYILQELATTCGTAASQRRRTVWFTINYPAPHAAPS